MRRPASMTALAIAAALAVSACGGDRDTGPASASPNDNGTFTVTGDVATLTEADFGSAGTEVAEGNAGIDFTDPHELAGPLRATVTRSDETGVTYQINAPVRAFARPGTFSRNDSATTLNGAIVFEDEEGETIADIGDIVLLPAPAERE